MTPETEGKEEKGPNGVPFINDPGSEDPGSLTTEDATVPLQDEDDEDDEDERERGLKRVPFRNNFACFF